MFFWQVPDCLQEKYFEILQSMSWSDSQLENSKMVIIMAIHTDNDTILGINACFRRFWHLCTDEWISQSRNFFDKSQIVCRHLYTDEWISQSRIFLTSLGLFVRKLFWDPAEHVLVRLKIRKLKNGHHSFISRNNDTILDINTLFRRFRHLYTDERISQSWYFLTSLRFFARKIFWDPAEHILVWFKTRKLENGHYNGTNHNKWHNGHRYMF